jgi:hypothetical protein
VIAVAGMRRVGLYRVQASRQHRPMASDPPASKAADDAAFAALQAVQSLTPVEFEAALQNEVGRPMLKVMNAVLRRLHPDDSDEQAAHKMRLMMVAFLLARRSAP